MFVGNPPLSSDPPDVTTHRGADSCDYTKNKTRKNKKMSEKNSIRKMCLCVCAPALRKACYPQGNKGLKLAEPSVPLLLLYIVGASALMYNVHEN